MDSKPSTLELAKALIAQPSVSPADFECQAIILAELEQLGFVIEQLPFGDVSNFWARRGTTAPLVCFAGHTDVVPAGDLADWHTEPFAPEEKQGYLYGRGAADMKGSLAAMLTACRKFVEASPDHQGSIAFLITSDEESVAINGTSKVIEVLEARNEKIDYCIVGEPSSTEQCGDVIKNGRRGSLNGILTVKGQAGHVAYPHLAKNPIHAFMPALAELCATQWDQGNQWFPATTFQISNINSGNGANNVIPGTMDILFNFRFSTEVSAQELITKTEAIFDKYHSDYNLQWNLSGNPFITGEGALVDAARSGIKEITGIETSLSTSGGTSDGRFIAPTGAQVVELGPVNSTIHQANECVAIKDLDTLSKIYTAILGKLLN